MTINTSPAGYAPSPPTPPTTELPVTVQTKIEPAQRDQLKVIAEDQGMKLSKLLNLLIKSYIKAYNQKKEGLRTEAAARQFNVVDETGPIPTELKAPCGGATAANLSTPLTESNGRGYYGRHR